MKALDQQAGFPALGEPLTDFVARLRRLCASFSNAHSAWNDLGPTVDEPISDEWERRMTARAGFTPEPARRLAK